jgi:hypothetical protein
MSANTTLKNVTTSSVVAFTCWDFTKTRQILYYVLGSMSIFGILSNLLCSWIFLNIVRNERRKSFMFYYFVVKSLNDSLIFVIEAFHWIYDCDSCEAKYSYWMQIWFIYFNYYLKEVTMMSSGFLEIAATFDCYNLITNKFPLFLKKRRYFYANIIIIYSFVFSFMAFHIFRFRVVSYKYHNKISYKTYKTNFRQPNVIFEIFYRTSSVLRDYLSFLIIVILNILIVFTLRAMNTRRRLINLLPNNKLVEKSQIAQRNKIRMILLTGFNHLVGHFGMSLVGFPIAYLKCISFLVFDLMLVSYVTPILIYLYNRNFRKRIINLFSLIVPCRES